MEFRYVATSTGRKFAERRLHKIAEKTLYWPVLPMSELVRWVARYKEGRTYRQIQRFFRVRKTGDRTSRTWEKLIYEAFQNALKKGYIRRI